MNNKYIGGLSLYFSLFLIKEVVDIGPVIKEKTKYLSYTFFFALFINFLSLYILIQFDGLRGVVFSLIISNLTLVSISWFISNYLYPVPFNKGHFLMLFFPVSSLSVVSMFFEITFNIRIIMVFLLSFFYLFYLFYFIKKYKSI